MSSCNTALLETIWNYLKLETICGLLQHSPSLHLDTHTQTHGDRRALPGAVNTTPLKHKREQETDVEKTISTKNPCHLFPSCHSISLVLKYFCHWGLCQSAKLVCHETHNESTQHQWASEWETFVCQVYNSASEIQSLFTWSKISDLLFVSCSTDSPRNWPVLYVDFCKKIKSFFA